MHALDGQLAKSYKATFLNLIVWDVNKCLSRYVHAGGRFEAMATILFTKKSFIFAWHSGCVTSLHCLCFSQVSDYHYLPDTGKRAERVKLCLQEGDELPRDFTALFDSSLYNLDTSVLPDAIKLVTLQTIQ